MNDTRINKLISQLGIASRRNAEKMIENGKVFINNKVAKIGQKVSLNDEIKINGVVVNKIQEHKYYLLNKPKKTICSLKDNFNRTIVTDLIDDDTYLFPVGRLDYDTTGVLLITNDGELANRLTHPSYNIKRVYRARLDKPITYQHLKYLNGQNVYVNKKLSTQVVEQIDNKSYLITISQGSYHHIKKLFELVERKVIDLKRIEFASLTCEKMMVGQYRKLKLNEIKKLKLLVNL